MTVILQDDLCFVWKMSLFLIFVSGENCRNFKVKQLYKALSIRFKIFYDKSFHDSHIYLLLSEWINLSSDFITKQTEAISQINGRERISLAVYKGFHRAGSARFWILTWHPVKYYKEIFITFQFCEFMLQSKFFSLQKLSLAHLI